MGALDTITVLDVTHVLAGPFCTYQMALLGADVLKVEPPRDPDCARGRGPDKAANARGLGLNYQTQGGNKRALALDLQDPDGRDILMQLIRDADVLVENYATGTMARFGLDYDAVSRVNPRLVYCSLTGFGDSGPEAGTGAYDNVIQAASGVIAQSGGSKPGVSFVDYSAGYAAAFAVVSALVQRGETGRGCHISVSMFEVAMQMMSPEVAAAQHPVKAAKPAEPGLKRYATADGELMLGVFRPAQYRRFGAMLAELGDEIAELSGVQSWEDVWALAETVPARIAATIGTRSTADWMQMLRDADLPAQPVRPLVEAVANPQLQARGYFQPNPQGTAETLPLTAFRMTEGGPTLRVAPPRHGQDSMRVLRELGLSEVQIGMLVAKGVVV